MTFLFTDIEGSTRLWEDHPEAMRTALARHDAILREAIERHSGVVFSTGGDGLAAAFGRAGAALAAAVDSQVGLSVEAWPEETSIRARMGLHTGEAEERAGDYFGSAVNRAARLMAIGHGGQILVSSATASLVHGSLPEGIGLIDLGEHRLRDLAEAMRVLQVEHADLPRSFPPLRSVENYPGNLPRQVSSFVGRERELDRVIRALDDARVVTLTGVGGVGKTRLALQVATNVLGRFREGAWLVELAPVRNPEGVAGAVAGVFGVSPQPGQSLVEALIDFLATKQALLVLDNCEHLLDATAGLIETLVRSCVSLTVLATSREGLGLPGEVNITVPSLGAPDPSDDLETLAGSDSVTLFVQRAQQVDSDFALSADNAGSVAQVCRRLDGVPLAIELAAARVRAMTPAELAHGLNRRFDTLAGGRRGAVQRHQTLRAAIDWSYDLLVESERRLLARLAVFAGGWTREAAEAICAADASESPQIFDHLVALVDRSLVIAQRGTARTRYRLLETIREYGEERLAELGETDALRARHAEYHADFLGEISGEIYGPCEIEAIKALVAEQENLAAAMDHAIDTGQFSLALRLLPSPHAGVQLGSAPWLPLEAMLGLPGARDHPRYPQVLVLGAWWAATQGDVDTAVARCQAAASAIERLGDPGRVVERGICSAQGAIATAQGQVDVAAAQMVRVAEIARSTGRFAAAALNLSSASIQHCLVGDADTAIELATEGLALARHVGMPTALIANLGALAGALAARDPEQAKAVLRESVEMRTALAYETYENWVTAFGAFSVAAHLEDWPTVLELAPRTLRLLNRANARTNLPSALEVLARALGPIDPTAAAVLQGTAQRRLASPAVSTTDANPDRSPQGPARSRPIIGRVADLSRETTELLVDAIGETQRLKLHALGQLMDDDEAVAYALEVIAKAQTMVVG